MTKDKTLKLALEAFEKIKNDADKQPPVYPYDVWRLWVDDAITAIKEALEQTENA